MPTAIVTGRLAARMGHRPFLVGGALLYAVAGLWFLLVPGAEPDYLGAWLPGLVLSGLSDVLRLLLLHDGRLAPSLPKAGLAVRQTAAGHAHHRDRQAGRAHGASAVPGRRRALYAVAGLWFLLVPGSLTIWAPGCRAWC